MRNDLNNRAKRPAMFKTVIAGLLATTMALGVLISGASDSAAAPGQMSDLVLNMGADSTQMNFSWFSDAADPGTPVVQVTGKSAVTGTQGSVTTNSGMKWNKVTVTGLEPDMTYSFRVSSNGTAFSPVYSFRTVGSGSFRFATVGDPQIGTTSPIDSAASIAADSASWAATVNKIAMQGALFIATSGDQIENAGQTAADIAVKDQEYTGFLAGLNQSSVMIPISPVMGNHEADGGSASGPGRSLFNEHYNPPHKTTDVVNGFLMANYYYIVNNVLFIVLDTAPYPANAAAAAGFIASYENTLAAATSSCAGKFDWLVVQTHKSQLSDASHWSDIDIQAYSLAGFEDLMTKYDVDLALTGHDHSYTRTYPMKSNFTTIGTGGAMVTGGLVIDQTNLGDQLMNPQGTVYMTMNSSTGSKYYAIHQPWKETSKVAYQTNQPQYTIIDVTDGKLSVATYLANSSTSIDSYSIEKTVSLSLDLNGGTGSVTSITVPIGTVPNWPAPPSKPADENNTYAFAGWFTQSLGGTQISLTAPIRADTKVFAHWTATPIADSGDTRDDPDKEVAVETGGMILDDSSEATMTVSIVILLGVLGLMATRRKITALHK